VSGPLKQDYLVKGVNPDRKSVVLQQAGGLGFKLRSSSCKHDNNASLDEDLRQGTRTKFKDRYLECCLYTEKEHFRI
jgi:hypothetical protein